MRKFNTQVLSVHSSAARQDLSADSKDQRESPNYPILLSRIEYRIAKRLRSALDYLGKLSLGPRQFRQALASKCFQES